MNSIDDSDCSNDSSHTVIMVDKDSGVIYPKSPQRLEAPRPIRMRSKSPRLETIKSGESVEEQQQSKPPLSLAARRNPSLSTVLEIPTTPCAEDAYQKEKCVIPYSQHHRRMSALITTSADPNDDEESRLNRRTSLKAPSLADGPLSPSADGWNAKAKIKYWKSRMSQQGQQMFRGGSGSSERRGSNLGLIPAITGLKRDIEGAGGSFRQRINSVGILKNNSDKSPREPMPDALANVFSKNGKQSESGSEGIRTPSGTGNHFFDETIPLPALKKPKWEDLDLWSNEPGSWSNSNSDVQLSASDKKRQNIIYELYMTEKNHVKVLVFLQQAYMVGLRQYNQASPFITEEQLDKLIPDVLDSLLDFHINLLRRLKKKKDENVIIETVSDIVEEEFGNGLFTTAAIRAYTIFCLSRDESCQIYAELMEKNPKFKKFFDHYEMQPAFKQHNFKSCFLLIAQRLTKYNLLFDSILKYDPIPLKAQSQRALTAVREFARRVDSELKKADINRQWDQLKSLLDKKSRGKILNRDFTYDDLVHQRMDDPRIVLAIGKVNYIASSVAQQTKDKIELTMVLFDDILVLFYLRNNSMHFYNANMISSVIPLKTMIVREMERGTNEIMLLCTDKEKPDLYHISFPSKSELRNWVTQINSAKASAVAVRYAPGRRSQVTLQKHEEFNEEPHNSKIQEWQESLQILFDERKQKEELLRDYMVGRMKFFDEVRAHFKKFPIRSITASTSTLPVAGSFIERRETRDLEKIKNFVQQKFLELRETRRSGLDSLVERAEKARDYDLQSFFDDLHDLTIAISSSSESSGTDGGVETSTTSNSEDEPTSSSPLSSKGKKPRRVRTYHGSTADSSSPRGKEGSLRRHTTVPKLGESGVIRSDEDDEEEQIDESLRKLPLSMPNRARKAATALICENVNLRIENNKLKSENALQEMHISSLKSRKTAGVETEEKLESLRQKQEEIQARERKLKQDQENFKDEMRRKADDLDAREEKMKRREAEIESRMQYTQATFRSGSCVFQENEHHHPPPTPSIPTTSPTILSLAAKTQVKPKHRK
uniref:DH domain-containing protein n=1 Tax=Panagrolaimus sp. PS1159 TaxID=55785 RepID=A0AC35FX36_9BILA